MSWGIGCFTKIPGVYADVGKATCFIDWAARCVDGTDIDNFGTSNGCAQDWAQTTYCDYKARIKYLESEVSQNRFIPCFLLGLYFNSHDISKYNSEPLQFFVLA